MRYLDSDIAFTEDGDFFFDEEKGDIKTVTNEENELLLQTILKRLQSSSRDWNIKNVVVADLEYFHGERSSESMKQLAEYKITEMLLAEDMLELEDISVDVEVFEDGKLGALISIFKKDSKLAANVNLGLLYDIKHNRFIPQFILGF